MPYKEYNSAKQALYNKTYNDKRLLANVLCSVPTCGKVARAKNLCGMHYQRLQTHGTLEIANPATRHLSVDERFWRMVNIEGTCWLWIGAIVGKGYGHFRGGISKEHPLILAHRYVYALVHGLIPEGLEVDHLCKVRNCVNPDHLEAVTRLENMLRSDNHIAKLIKT